jgi:hypothetical protein
MLNFNYRFWRNFLVYKLVIHFRYYFPVWAHVLKSNYILCAIYSQFVLLRENVATPLDLLPAEHTYEGKGEAVPGLNWVPCHEDALGNRGTAPLILNPSTRWRWVASPTPWGKNPQHTRDRKLGPLDLLKPIYQSGFIIISTTGVIPT